MECAIRTIRKINFNMGAIKVEDTKRIRFSNMAKFMFNEDQAIIFNRLNGQWIKVPKQCYDILELCNKEGLSWSALSESLADDEDREYMKQLIKLLDSMNCLYNDDEKIIENISFAITHRCNLKCIHCMVNAAFGQSDKEHFDTKTICAFLDKIVAANPKNITLTGGEPLLRSDFLTILGYLRSIYNGKITLMTNGTLITPKNVKEIVSQIDSIDISLDGADEESCAVIRGKGVFEKVVSSIKLLQSHGFSKISISMVLSANNVRYTKQFMELNESLNTTPMLRALSYEGRAKENKDILDNVVTTEFLRQEDKKTNSECRTCCCTAGYNQITIEANGDIFPCNLFVEPEFRLGIINDALSKMANSPCNGGTSTFSIDTDGVIYPCVVTVGIPEFVVGTIKEGVNKEKVTEILGWDKIEITECIGCSRYNYCNTTRCRMINKVMCGSLHTPSAIVCSIENLKVKLSEYYLQRNIANL